MRADPRRRGASTVEGRWGCGQPSTRVTVSQWALGARELSLPSHPCYLTGMDTSTTPHVSPVLDPETMTALMLRYALIREDVAHQYARALIRRLCADVGHHEVFQLARDIVTEITNDIRTFEDEEGASRVDVALRRLIDRVEADEEFMTELAD